MTTTPEGADTARRHRRRIVALKQEMRELNVQMSLLNRQVGARLNLKEVDLSCLDLINQHGPLSPSALARRAGLHPATMTGILDRLERGGWVIRERDPAARDRRAVTVRVLRERNPELYQLLAGMNDSMDKICSQYTEEELDLISEFLRRARVAGEHETDGLMAD